MNSDDKLKKDMLSKHKVLVLTGGLLTEKETSLFEAIRKQYLQKQYSKDAWLDIKLKVLTLEPIISLAIEKTINFFLRRIPNKLAKQYFSSTNNLNPPELTEVVLATHLKNLGVNFELATISELFSNKNKMDILLSECDCVFFSTTFLRDLSELIPLIKIVNRYHNHIVLGGALVGLIHEQWREMEEVDVLAVGYGEILLPVLADWIESDYSRIKTPTTGSLITKDSTHFIFSGLPDTHILDFLPRVDWEIAMKYHNKSYDMIYYESVRGCPYSCSFCNYPYLFDDNKFRYFSAERIADDWGYYVNELGVTYITCLDSLFTVPKRRLVDLCNLLIKRNIQVKWICYARADDLADEDVVQLMKRAGAHQVQIGIESGHPDILNNMDKRCTVESNANAISNCRKYGLTTVISLIVGFPGETSNTLEASFQFLKNNPPDFYYLAIFSTRATKVPILNQANREKFKLKNADSEYTMAPYWKHQSMNCLEASDYIRTLNQRLMKEKVSLNAVLFYKGLLNYDILNRNLLLKFQERVSTKHVLLRKIFTFLNKWINKKMNKDIQNYFSSNTYTLSDKKRSD